MSNLRDNTDMLDIQESIPLAPLTTFQIGGLSRYFAKVRTTDETKEAIVWAREHTLPFAILAGGSNVLVADEGYDGLVIQIASSDFSFDYHILTADAGCNLLSLIREASSRGLGGWEKLAGIPGTIGGAARGNAGAFGTEIKDVATSVHALHRDTFEVREFSNVECTFSYRQSFFKSHPEWIITSVEVELTTTTPQESQRLADETIAEREKRHLQNVRAAGSYFMNPVAPAHIVEMFELEKSVKAREGRVPAGWLIEKVGMKGMMVGGAMASLQHPNYLVNASGTATAEEVQTLAKKIKTAVREQFGVELHEEAAIF
jgi:UDP-N-acetylmuramate dehydrogenase